MLIVKDNKVELQRNESAFLAAVPKVIQANYIDANGKAWNEGDVAGVQLKWQGTEDTAGLTAPIQRYSIYRNDSPGDVNAWRWAASVGAGTHTYTDKAADGCKDVDTRSPWNPLQLRICLRGSL